MEENNNIEIKTEETKEVKKEYKKHGFVYWLIVILGMGFIVFMSIRLGEKIAEEKIDKDGENGTTTTSNSNSNATSNKVDSNEVTEAEKTAVNEKMRMLFSNGKIENNFIGVSSLSDIWAPLFKGNVSELDLLKVLLRGIDVTEFDKYTATNGTFSSTYQNMNKGDALAATKLDAYYNKLTGKNITSYVDITLGCPMFAYDSTNKVYVEIPGCGGVSASGQLVYLDSYTKVDNTIVIGTYVGGIFDEGAQGAIIYSDYYDAANKDNLKVYKKLTNSDFKIDESNKTSFTKYNFTFEKSSNGEYYFKSVTKAN